MGRKCYMTKKKRKCPSMIYLCTGKIIYVTLNMVKYMAICIQKLETKTDRPEKATVFFFGQGEGEISKRGWLKPSKIIESALGALRNQFPQLLVARNHNSITIH